MAEDAQPEKDIIVVHGDVCIRKERKRRRKLLLWDLLYEFSRSTTLHGLRYITEKNLSIIEKIFWFITFLTSMSLCFYSIYNVYDKWQSTPVIVTISEDLVHVSKIPFPSITICPQTKCRVSQYNYSDYEEKVDNFMSQMFVNYSSDMLSNITSPRWVTKHIDISTICQNDFIPNYMSHFMSEKVLRNASLVHHIEEVAESSDELFITCSWRTEFDDCNNYFKKVLTQEGLCYNFNALAADEILRQENVQKEYKYLDTGNESVSKGWHPYYGYLSRDFDSYPRRGRSNGAYADLDIILYRNVTEKDESCNTLNNGYKIYLHHPGDLPQSSLYYFAALDGQVSSLAVKCNILNTSSKLYSKTSEQRKCYFEGEKKLTYFKMYTRKNCLLECWSNFTFKTCGCVGFFMPHDNSSQLCHLRHTSCIAAAEDMLADIEASDSELNKYVQKCNCLPPCYSIEYDAEVLKTNFELKTLIKRVSNDHVGEESSQFSRIVVFFQQPEFVSMRRSELFGTIDFVANCGGLLGLFLGFSFLSIIEIIYFATFRIWYTLRKDLKQEKKATKKTTKNS